MAFCAEFNGGNDEVDGYTDGNKIQRLNEGF